ncbi:MAG: hypothetical protein ABIX01_17425 [Chitinophagaceae bacterium]
MKKLRYTSLSICMLVFASCKNSGTAADSNRRCLTSTTATTEKAAYEKPTIANAPLLETAAEYNNYIIQRQRKIYNYIFELNDMIKSDPAAAQKLIDTDLPEIVRIGEEVKVIPPFRGDFDFRDAAIRLFDFYKTTFEVSYRELMEIKVKGDKKTKEDLAEMQEIMSAVSCTEKGLDLAMMNAQSFFATANNMAVQDEPEMQAKVENMKNNNN